jgi:hypothetical protein
MKKTLVAIVLSALAACAWARLPLADFGAPDLNIDLHASLLLSQDTWGIPVPDANRIAMDPRITPDDFTVAAFLSRHASVGIEVVWRQRQLGVSWFDLAVRLGVPMDTVIVRPSRDFGPPYGKAWGYWKKHPKRGDRTFFLDDPDFIRMVEVQTLCRSTGKSADDVILALQGEESFTKWASKLSREKHGKGQGAQGKPAEVGGGKGKGKGKGK